MACGTEGDWKPDHLNTKPTGSRELYKLAEDPTEMTDFAAKEPVRVKGMAAAFGQ